METLKNIKYLNTSTTSIALTNEQLQLQLQQYSRLYNSNPHSDYENSSFSYRTLPQQSQQPIHLVSSSSKFNNHFIPHPSNSNSNSDSSSSPVELYPPCTNLHTIPSSLMTTLSNKQITHPFYLSNQTSSIAFSSNPDESVVQNQQNTSSGPKRAKSTFPFGKCKVCSDKATGVHYGIATCEGCKVSNK